MSNLVFLMKMIFKMLSIFLRYFDMISIWKRVCNSFEHPCIFNFYHLALCQVCLKLALRFNGRILNIVNIFSLFRCDILFEKWGCCPSLNKLDSPLLHIMIVCENLVEISPVLPGKNMKMETFLDRQMERLKDRQTTDGRQPEKLIWAFNYN